MSETDREELNKIIDQYGITTSLEKFPHIQPTGRPKYKQNTDSRKNLLAAAEAARAAMASLVEMDADMSFNATEGKSGDEMVEGGQPAGEMMYL